MFIIIRDPITNADFEVDSLTGFVKGEAVDTEHLGTPLSEAPASPAGPGVMSRRFILPPE